MHLLAAVYLIVLVTCLSLGIRASRIGWPGNIIALFLLVWAVFIGTAQILSLLSALNETNAYVGLSIVLSVSAGVGLRFITPESPVAFTEIPSSLPPKWERYVAWFLIVTIGLVFAADLVLAYGLLPANPDSIAYRFPRAY